MATNNAVNNGLSSATGTGNFVGSDSPTFSTQVTIDNIIITGVDIQHSGDTDNKITFGTDTQSYETGGSSRIDISDSGVRLGGANSRVTTILDEDTMSSDSATALATQQSIKAYVDSKYNIYPFTDVTGTSQAMSVNNGYIANNVALVTLTLPATAAVGDTLKIQGFGAGLFKIAQNAGQTIHFGSSDTTTGVTGSITATNRYDSFEMVCVVTDTDFCVLSGAQGVLTVA